MRKLEMLLEDERNLLSRCVYCNSLFTKDQLPTAKCRGAKLFIDFHGNVIASHVGDGSWNLNKFINYLHSTCRLPWRDIYWKVWAHTLCFDCRDCRERFAANQHFLCAYHPDTPLFSFGSNTGM